MTNDRGLAQALVVRRWSFVTSNRRRCGWRETGTRKGSLTMSTTRFRLHHMQLLGLLLLCVALLALGLPGATITRAAGNGEDYASNELGNPWDMSDASDIAFEYTRDNGSLGTPTFSGGELQGTATNA